MKSVIKKAWGNSFVRGGAWLTGSSFIINILNFLFTSFAGRSLGREGYGEFAALLSYISIFSLPVSIISLIIVQRVGSAEKREEYAYAAETVFWETVKKYGWLLAASLLLIPVIPHYANLTLLSSAFLIPLVFLSFLVMMYQSFLSGLHLFRAFAVISLVTALLKLSGAVVNTFAPIGLPLIITMFFISLLYGFLGELKAFRLHVRREKAEPVRVQKSLFSIIRTEQMLITTATVGALTLVSNVDIVIAKKFLDASAIGVYSAWSLFAKIILYAVGPLLSITYIYFAQKDARQTKQMFISLGIFAVLGMMSYLGYTLLAPLLVGVVFGADFLPVVPYLGQASIFGILYCALVYLNNYFLAQKSRYALILPMGVPIYIALFFFGDHTIISYISINIAFAAVMTALYVGALIVQSLTSSPPFQGGEDSDGVGIRGG